MKYVFNIFVLFVLIILSFNLLASPPVNLNNSQLDISWDLELYFGDEGSMSIETIQSLSDNHFTKLKKTKYLGFNNNIIWAKVFINFEENSPVEWVVFDNILTFDHLDFYVVQDGNISHQTNGLIDKNRSQTGSRKLTFRLSKSLTDSSAVIYMKLQTQMPFLIDLRIQPYHQFIAQETVMSFIMALYFGFMFIFFIYSLLVSKLNPLYFWVAGFILTITLWDFVAGGQSIQYLNEAWTLDQSIGFIDFKKPGSSLMLVSFIYFSYFSLFVSKYLSLKTNAPDLNKVSNALFIIGVMCGLGALVYRDKIFVIAMILYHTAVVLLAFYASWKVARLSNQNTSTFVAPFFLMMLGFFAFNLANLGLFDSIIISRYLNFIAPLFVVIFLFRGVDKLHYQYEGSYQKSLLQKNSSALVNELQVKVIDRFKEIVSPQLLAIEKITDRCLTHPNQFYTYSQVKAEIIPINDISHTFRDIANGLSSKLHQSKSFLEFNAGIKLTLNENNISIAPTRLSSKMTHFNIINADLVILILNAFLKAQTFRPEDTFCACEFLPFNSKKTFILRIKLIVPFDHDHYKIMSYLEMSGNYSDDLDFLEYSILSQLLPQGGWKISVDNRNLDGSLSLLMEAQLKYYEN